MEWRVVGIPLLLGKNHRKKSFLHSPDFVIFGWNTWSYCHYLDTCLRCQVTMAESRDLEGVVGEKQALNAIVEWLIQPHSDLRWPLEFLICKIMNSLLFKPA